MKKVDLDKYKTAWNNEPQFHDNLLSETDVQDFMKSTSKSIGTLFKKGLFFDIVFKVVLFISFALLALLLFDHPAILSLALSSIIILVLGILWQFKINRKIPRESEILSIVLLLKNYINFYQQKYLISIYISALSSSLLFLCGSLFYLFFKYREIPVFDLADYLVTGIGIVLSFSLSAITQVKQNNFRVNQLKKSLTDIIDEAINKESIQNYKRNLLINRIVVAGLLIIGLLLLLFFILKLIY